MSDAIASSLSRAARAAMTLANRALDAARRASRVARSATRAAYDAVAPGAIARYEKTMAANAEYVVRDEARARRLARELVYTNLARLPRAIEAARAEAREVGEAARRARAGEADVATIATGMVFAAETYAWFCVGEIVGRGGKLTGY